MREDLREVRPQGHERRTQIDIVFEKVLSHVDAQIKSCPHCGAETRTVPRDLLRSPAVRLGHQGVRADLLMAQMVSLQRVQQMIQTSSVR
ncbi:MAG: hypothetical protein IPF50_12730 [Proteobacteria bacterium]|nr:hypothetical protein [Pseudomonadota bacterium]